MENCMKVVLGKSDLRITQANTKISLKEDFDEN